MTANENWCKYLFIFICKGIQHRSDERTKINQFSLPPPRKPNPFPSPPPAHHPRYFSYIISQLNLDFTFINRRGATRWRVCTWYLNWKVWTRSTVQGLKMRMCVVGDRVKNWYFSLKDSEGGGISEIQIQKKKKQKKNKKNRAFRNKAIRK